MVRSRDIFAYVACSGPQRMGTIRFYRLDTTTGYLEFIHQSEELGNPSFLVVHPDQRKLYCVNEMDDYQGQSTGAVSSFAIDPQTWRLTLLGQQSSMGAGPCFVGLDNTGRYAQVANFSGGSLSIYPVRTDGSLGPASDFVQHPTLGDKVPRAHSVRMDPTNRIAVACDLGLDRVFFYRVDLEHGTYTPNDQPWLQLAPGAGPRHLEFHPNGKWLYVINELGNTMSTIAYDAAAGRFDELQTISTLPPGYSETSYCGDVHVSADGRFVYGTNRGHNSIVCLAIDPNDGTLTPVAWEPCQGDFPRNCALDPTGRWFFSLTHVSNNMVSFGIDRHTGVLTPTGFNLEVQAPLCIKFVVA